MKILILVGTALAETVTARIASTDAVNGHWFHAASGGISVSTVRRGGDHESSR